MSVIILRINAEAEEPRPPGQARFPERQVSKTSAQHLPAPAFPDERAPGSQPDAEVRAHDYGWGQANDRNLLGRFSTQVFTLPRLARTQNYFLRLYDNSSPPRYSRHSAALHLDYPL